MVGARIDALLPVALYTRVDIDFPELGTVHGVVARKDAHGTFLHFTLDDQPAFQEKLMDHLREQDEASADSLTEGRTGRPQPADSLS